MPCVPPPSVLTDVEGEATDVPEQKCRRNTGRVHGGDRHLPWRAGAPPQALCTQKWRALEEGPPEIRRQDGRSGLGGGLDAGVGLEALLVHVGELTPPIRGLVLRADALIPAHRF